MGKVNTPRLLVVDDDPYIVNLLLGQLAKLTDASGIPAAVSGVTNPIEALELARNQRFDVVISDFRMPQMDGVSFLEAFTPLQPQCVRLVLSGQSDTEALARLVRDAAIFRYLPKPWSEQELHDLVQEALRHHARAASSVPKSAMPKPTTTTLRTAPLLVDLPEERLRQLAAVAEWQVHKAGETILQQNAAAQSVYFVIAGYVKVLRGGTHTHVVQTQDKGERRVRSRHQVMLALLGPGDMVGEVATLLDANRSATIMALTPCQVIGLPSHEFLNTMQQHPAFAMEIARKMARRLVAADHQMELLRGDLEGRIHALVRHCKAIGLDTERWLSNAEIARMVGATRAAVSPIMGRLQKQKGPLWAN